MNAQAGPLPRMYWIPRVLSGILTATAVVLLAAATVVLSSEQVRGQEPTPGWVSLTVDGVEIGSFPELVGVSSEADARFALGRPIGRPTVQGAAMLRRPVTNSRELWDWYQRVVSGDLAGARKSASIIVYDRSGGAIARYHLQNAWPSRIEIGTLKAGDSQVLTETVTLTYEKLVLE